MSELEIQEVPVQPVEGAEVAIVPGAYAENSPAPAPVVVPELRYEYQPTDDSGRPLGAKQVIKYRAPEELAAKLVEQNTLLIRKLREETRKNRLGILEDETIPDDAPRYSEPVQFRPRDLTPDERMEISRNLLDPERFDEASDALFEAKMGAKPQIISQTLAELQQDRLEARAKVECDAFVADNPGYVKCQENFVAITNWMMRYGLAPVKTNFQRAYDKLRADKVMIETFVDVPEQEELPTPEPVLPVEPAPVVEPQTALEPPKPVQRIATGLSRSNSDEVGATRSLEDDIVYEVMEAGKKRRFTGLAAINAMPSDEYRRRVMTDPNFAKKEAQLHKDSAERRRVR